MTRLEELRARHPEKPEAWIMDHVAGNCPEPIPEMEDCAGDCIACWNREIAEEDTSSVSAQALTPSPRGEGFDGLTAEREGAILEAALAKWGEAAQAIKAIEELSELQTQLARWALASILGSARSPSRKRQGSTAGRNLLSNSEQCSEFGRNDSGACELSGSTESESRAGGSDEVGDLMPRRKDPEALARSIREEIADCYIMLEQMELVFGDVAEIEEEKLLRLEEDVKDASE